MKTPTNMSPSTQHTDSVSTEANQGCVPKPESDIVISLLDLDVLHRDNFKLDQFADSFIFVLSVEGKATIQVDLTELDISHGHGIIMRPGQIYRCIDTSPEPLAYGVAIARSCIPEKMFPYLDYLLLDGSPFEVSEMQRAELTSLFNMLLQRGAIAGAPGNGIEAILAHAFAAIMAEALCERTHRLHSDKLNCMPLLSRLTELFNTDLHISRLPSHYASQLGITPTYLNEKLRAALGLNISLFIRRESIIHACRLLTMTQTPIREIAATLGYNDPAYFTRIFTKITGDTPSSYRRLTGSQIP